MYSPSIDNVQIFTALRSWLLSILPANTEVVQGLDNRVPTPLDSFVLMTPITRERLATNTDSIYDVTGGVNQSVLSPWKHGIQIDCFGPQSDEWMQAIVTLWRDDFAVSQFPAGITPLYADDPRQLVFVDDQMQYDRRWMAMLYLQADPVITTPAQSATTLTTPTPNPA